MECVVIGGGLVGMATARELAAGGLRVRLIERGECGRESSWAGGGILSPLVPWAVPEAVGRLAAWGQAHYEEYAAVLADRTGIDSEWTRSGLLHVDPAPEDVARARRWADAQGVPFECVEAPDLPRLEPACRPARSGVWLPDVAQVRNPRLLRALKADLCARGVMLDEHVEVTGIVTRGGRARGVNVGQAVIGADCVVVAGGAWSAGLLAPIGVRSPIAPVKGQMLMFHAAPGTVTRILFDRGHYLVPRRDGRVLAGSTLEESGFDRSTTREAYAELVAAAGALAPSLSACPVERHWAGLRPGSPDGIPTIGPVPGIEGLFVNAGHFRNGVLLAPASARLVADLILQRPPILEPEPYAVTAA